MDNVAFGHPRPKLTRSQSDVITLVAASEGADGAAAVSAVDPASATPDYSMKRRDYSAIGAASLSEVDLVAALRHARGTLAPAKNCS